jgi:hypothetical protein
MVASFAHAAEPVEFRVHVLNPDSEFSAAAAFDVDHDGDLDVVSGGFWYAAPDWVRHTVREVENIRGRNIRGRFDDYSNLPLDVNGDAWIDLVSCNYRSRSIYWVEHPGPGTGEWTKHVIDTPGPSETGRLADVDGDGDPDVLPNGTDFAAWYELERTAAGQVAWTRHDLPGELAGHGLGFGDVNGDGRGDVVGRAGWAEAPDWVWHGEFELDRDGSIPILVEDVDGDGDNDLIWGRGHDYGVYWLEQAAEGDGNRNWSRHVIDDTWSCAHAILWADIDGDGRDDLIAGKRYLGHDGRDPGETDPLQINWYRFDAGVRHWTRHAIHTGGTVGMDLDPKAVDLDADGDLDLLCPARCGLHWIENLRIP